MAAPLAIPSGSDWIGYDGNWSPVAIRVGSPSQWMNVLPNTGSSETWVIGRGGCDSTMKCRTERGGLFLSNESSTWNEVGFYELGNTLQLGHAGIGDYGLDIISMDNQLDLEDQVVSILNTTEWWIGSLGLGTKKTTFTGSEKLSVLSTLVENRSLVPSHSYGYTAGASYRLKGVRSSLTFGGVDRNRFVENNVTFTLSPDDLPVVTVKSIKVSTNLKPLGSNLVFRPLDALERYTIDSSTPFFWFPEYVCTAFAEELGLEYNDTLQLYTYGPNSSKYDNVTNSNISFTFTLSDLPGSRESVDITLPFSAFDHELSYPFPKLDANASSQALRYFPIRKTSDTKKFTLGRAFLQEVYLAVDFERRNFSISQAKFPSDGGIEMDLVAISRPPDSSYKGPSDSRRRLSKGAAAGIGVGVSIVVIVAACVVATSCLRRRKRELLLEPNEKEQQQERRRRYWKFWRSSDSPSPSELLGDEHFVAEAPADSSVSRFELPGSSVPAELEASEVTNPLYSANRKRRNGSDAPPAYEHRNTEDFAETVTSNRRLSPGTGPPVYVLSDVPLDTDDYETYLVSPLAMSSTFNGSHSTTGPSPLTPSADRSFSGSFPQASSQSVSPPGNPASSRINISNTGTHSPVFENVQGTDGSLPPSTEAPRVVRRKFSWEE
ncbi:hypothetical protein D8B26_002654 [Coccidioides posadasii str. Silveira]|nr:hypothetical protein D8B26_002654 [Coccidioides posadasii str. Silveira]